MTDFNNLFQVADLSQQRMVQSASDIGGGYLPISLTANLTITSLSSAFGLTLSLDNIRTLASSSSIQTSPSVTSSSQSDALLGTTASAILVGSDIVISNDGKKNKPDPTW